MSGTTIDLSNQTEIFTITGGNFIDNITSGKGDDTIDGGGEADSITGGAGDDIITGGSGNDIITVDFGTDTVKDLGGSAGGDDDVVVVNANASLVATDVVDFEATASTQNNSTDADNASLSAKDGVDAIINMSAATGSSGAFKLRGGTGQDSLTGGAGADIIWW